MTAISNCYSLQWNESQKTEQSVSLHFFSEPNPAEFVVKQLVSIKGPLDIYCWYEGTHTLPKAGAEFMKAHLLEPIYRNKKDAKFFLYSLKGWDFSKKVTDMPSSTSLGETINRINTLYVECVYSYSFFKYCAHIKQNSSLSEFVNCELPKKEWLFKLSVFNKKCGKKVSDFFNQQCPLFDFTKDLDVTHAYSAFQYVEGYFLIEQSVKRGIEKQQKKIEVAFLLPNDESKYYLDYEKDIKKLLQKHFGKDLESIEVIVYFYFFQYGNSLQSRPYINKPKEPTVKNSEIASYFDYLSSIHVLKTKPLFIRDLIHHLNEW